MGLFGTNGVRGKLTELTPSLAFDLAASFGTWTKGSRVQAKIALARDMRVTSPMIASAVRAGILSSGKDVLDMGICSSPVAEFMHSQSKCAGLIIVTASHNPPEWNALKFVDENGVAVSSERGAEIEKMALGKTFNLAAWDNVGKLETVTDAAEQHAKAALAALDIAKIKKRKLKVALDFGNGTSTLSSALFSSLGCKIVALNEKLDGTFPGRLSEPSEKNVQALLSAVKKNSCDLGVAWDGDSDRVVFVDEKGNWIVGDKGFAISARAACAASKKKEKFVVTTVATSRVVDEACAQFGAKTIYTKVGAPYLSEKMHELGASAASGGEEVGGIIWPSFSLAKDGIYAAGRICEMVCDKPLSQLVAELPVYYNSKTVLQVKDNATKQKGLASAKQHADGMKGKLLLIDGVRVDFDDGWVIVRASGTENAMRVFAEGKTQKRAEELMNEMADVVKAAVA
ncbi:MAG: phosphoglucosamine mutase [Candidatus Micrarchaeota archaeon]|nr:phosphoglucosamine mutase [Candidatus Micrarchaeota archaeon]